MNKLQLDRNEQIGVILCSVAIIALIFLGMYIYTGPRKKYLASREELTSLVDQLATMEQLKQSELDRIESQKKLVDLLQNREPGFNLFSFVDKTIDPLKAGNHASASTATRGRDTKDTTMDMVTLSLRNVGLTQIIDVLHTLYSSKNLIVVQRMDRLAPAATGPGLDCDLILATLKS